MSRRVVAALALLGLAALLAGALPAHAQAPCTRPHAVAPGESCYQIATLAGLSLAGLLRMNPGLDCARLQPGDGVCIDRPPAACGQTRTVQAGDSCYQLSVDAGLSLDAFQAINPGVQCSPLPVGQRLCTTQATCTRGYVVQPSDTCFGIAQGQGTSVQQLLAWNTPTINDACSNLQAGDVLCTAAMPMPAPAPPPPPRPSPQQPPPSPSPPPGLGCNETYTVKPGEFCFQIAVGQGLSLARFLELNPGLPADCSGLLAGQTVCVGPPAPGPPPRPYDPPPVPPIAPLPTPKDVTDPLPPLPPLEASCQQLGGVVATVNSRVTSITQLARQLQLTAGQVAGYNANLALPLAPGARVCIPAAACKTHKVAAGQYLYGVARQHGTAVEDLVALNPSLLQQGINTLRTGQLLIVAPCKSNPGARPRAKVLDPELLASARLFAPASPAVAAALGRYEAAPGAASRDALRGALRAFWATEAGRQALLRAQRGGSAFGKYVKSQETDRAAKCAQYRKGTMPKALADCVCNTAQPLFYCESRLQADMERRFAGLLKGGGQAALARQLQEQVAEELSVLFEGLRRDMRQYKRGQAARGSQPAGGGAGTAGAAARAAAAVVPYGRQLAEGGIKMGCSNLTVLFQREFWIKAGLGQPLCYPSLDCEVNFPACGPIPLPCVLSGKINICIPWAKWPNAGEKMLEVCAREGQCQQVSLDDQQKLTALVDSTIGASVSICLGMGKLKDVMKYLGINVCLELGIRFFPFQGALKISASANILVVSFTLEFHIQLDDEVKEKLGLCDTEAECKRALYCRLNEGDSAGSFTIGLRILWFSWDLAKWDFPIKGGNDACTQAKAKQTIAKTPITKLVVYTTDWSQWRRSNNGRPGWCDAYAYTPGNIDPSVPTHVNYAFAKIQPDGQVVHVEQNEPQLIAQLQALKGRNPALKTLISIGGWSFSRGEEVFTGTGSEKIFPAVAGDAAKRGTFVRSAIQYAQQYGFDGIDIDWEFPNWEGRAPGEVGDFTALMRELRVAAAAQGLLLTAALRASPTPGTHADVKAVADLVDWINLMTYDYHGNFDYPRIKKVNSNAPIKDCHAVDANWDIEGALDAYEKAGVPMSKIVMGLATYGRGFVFAGGEAAPGLGGALDSSQAPPLLGDCTNTSYTMSWYEIKRQLNAEQLTPRVDPNHMAAYSPIQGGKYWIGFDTPTTHAKKMCYARGRGIGGIMVWDSDTDDQLELLKNIKAKATDACADYQQPRC